VPATISIEEPVVADAVPFRTSHLAEWPDGRASEAWMVAPGSTLAALTVSTGSTIEQRFTWYFAVATAVPQAEAAESWTCFSPGLYGV
jgi:hypothetical protein